MIVVTIISYRFISFHGFDSVEVGLCLQAIFHIKVTIHRSMSTWMFDDCIMIIWQANLYFGFSWMFSLVNL